jgi:hypothetical protein
VTGDLEYPFALNRQLKDLPDNGGGFLVYNPKIFVAGAFHIAVGRDAKGLPRHFLCPVRRFHFF